MSDAFVEWINTFEHKSHEVDSLVELADGIILSQVLLEIDPIWFKTLTPATDASDNWMIRFNNLKKLHKLVIRYYEEIMGQDIECIPVVNLNAIAKDADAKDLLRLCQLVVALAVQSENNNMYIEMIQSLTQKSQHALMVSIEEIMSQINDVDGRAAGESGEFESGFSSPNGSLQYQAEFEKLLGERKTLEKSHKHLVEKYDDLRSRYEELEADKEDLKSRLLDMDAAVTQANDTGKADFIMRTEIEHLKQDLLRSEDRRQETELVIEKQNRKIAENERKIEDLSKTAEQVQYLNDQLEEYKHTEEKLHKMENAIEKYKKRLEDGADLRRQIKALEEQNATLMERNHQVEDEYRKVLAFKTLMDSYKEQVHNLENDKAEILIEKHKIEEALRKAEERCNMLEQDKARDQDQIHSLEDQLAELELGGAQSMGSITDQQNVATMNTVVDTPNMEEDLQKANVAEMQLTIKRLEEQIVHLQANASDVKNEQLDALQAKIEASSAGERQWQQKHADLESRYQLLEKDILQIREGIPDTLPKQMQAIKTFRARIIDLEKEGKYLSESTSAFEKRVTEATRAISKDGATLDAFEKEYAVQQERINRLEDITKIQLHDINRLLIEANYLNGINNKSGSNLDDAPGMSDKELENLKERNATLQIQVLHLQEELNETQSKIRRAREMIKLYSKLFKESLVTNVRPHDLSYMQKVPRTREEENELLKRQIHDVRLQSRKEQQLIISSWYELARREKRDSASLSGRPTSSSWLGRQRKILENQLKKR
ncbi:unnamed protein product [Umbelopsis sp. WA50703]